MRKHLDVDTGLVHFLDTKLTEVVETLFQFRRADHVAALELLDQFRVPKVFFDRNHLRPGGAIVNWPKRRRLLSRFANTYIRMVTRLDAHDCTSGYRCWRRDALAALPLDRFISDGYSFLVEMLFVADRRGLRITEVPITFVERRLGESKLSRAVIVESAVTPWRLVATRGMRQDDRR